MNTYYIFGAADVSLKTDSTIIKSTNITLTEDQSLRLFGFDFLSNRPLILYEISPKNPATRSKIFNYQYFSDCNEEIYSLLSKNNNLYGHPSRRFNSILNTILLTKEGKVSLLGENGWPSLEVLFKTLSKASINYVVLRKFENLPQGFIEDDHDIDLLCDNLYEMLLLTGATKRNIGISSYQLTINNEKTDFDIRFVGDNYLDSSWARAALETRETNENGISVMNKENQLFSMLYHCLTQKTSISNYYLNQIDDILDHVFAQNFPRSKETFCVLLAYYMKAHAYTCPKPLDTSVVQNKANIKMINNKLRSSSRKTEFLRNLYIKTPHKIKSKIPESKKQKLYKM